MTALLRVVRAGPMTTLQDGGRPGLLRQGIAASGPMDRAAWERAGGWLGGAGTTAIEFTRSGIVVELVSGTRSIAGDGGHFEARRGDTLLEWPMRTMLAAGERLTLSPGHWGNYGYLRFDAEVAVEPVLGSRSTNSTVGLGGLDGRPLLAGDVLRFGPSLSRGASTHPRPSERGEGPIRVIWGLHAASLGAEVRSAFLAEGFRISDRIDRMGVTLVDTDRVFAGLSALSLVSEAVVPGDIQILGDGTPVVLMRDHQPTGGYPRIATIVTADLDRFAQLRPGEAVRFAPVTVAHAHALRGQG